MSWSNPSAARQCTRERHGQLPLLALEAEVGLEQRPNDRRARRRRPRHRRRPGRAASRRSPTPRRCRRGMPSRATAHVRRRTSAVAAPNADSTDASSGTMTVCTPIACAMSAANNPPHPPKLTSARPRGVEAAFGEPAAYGLHHADQRDLTDAPRHLVGRQCRAPRRGGRTRRSRHPRRGPCRRRGTGRASR